MAGPKFASGKRAIAECDRCGQTYKLKTLKELIVKGNPTNLLVCTICWEPDHPQLHLGETPVYDPEALRNPRPDEAGYDESRSMVSPSYQDMLDDGSAFTP